LFLANYSTSFWECNIIPEFRMRKIS
jgi:hypothetical protein